MPIKSGIGFGEAQVYNQPGAINSLYGKLLQQQAKDQAQFATDLNNVMSKYSTKGLKDADIKLTADAYQQIKDKVAQYSARKPIERAQALAEARNGIQAIQEYADSAINAYKTLDQIAPEIANNTWKYEQGTGDVIKKLYELPYHQWGDNYKNLNQSTFQRKPDNSSVYKLLNDVNSDLSKIAPVTGKSVDNVTGKHITTYFNVPKEQALNNLYTAMELNPQAKYTLTNLYQQANPDKKDFTPAEVADFGLQLYAKQYGDNAFKFYGGRTAIPKAGGSGADSEKLTYRQQDIVGFINGDSKTKERVLANLPQGTVIDYRVSKAIPGVSKGGYDVLRVKIPGYTYTDAQGQTQTIGGGIEDINLNEKAPAQRLNYILNKYSNEKISPSKLGIEGGRPRGELYQPSKAKTPAEKVNSDPLNLFK